MGAVVIDGRTGSVLAQAGNEVEAAHDPTAHAEMLAIRTAAAARGTARLVDCDIYVTLEPCAMCAQAIAFARLRRLYFGAADPKGGGVEHGARIFQQPTCHHRPEVIGGIQESRAAALLREFFEGPPVEKARLLPPLPGGCPNSIRARRHSTGENPWRPSAPFRSSSPMPPAAT